MALLWMFTTFGPYLKLKPSSVSELTALEEGNFVAHGFGVAIEKFDAFAGSLAAGLHAGLSAPDHDDVVAETEEAVEDAFAEAFAVAEQKHDGDESPDDAEHGEAGAQAVAQKRVDALTNDSPRFMDYSALRHSMGLRLAARKAGYMPANNVMAVRVVREATMASGEMTGCGTKSGSGTRRKQQTDADAEGQAGDSADERDDGGFDEELAFDVDGGCAERFADADFARALGDGDEHDVHDADAAEGEGEESDGSEEEGHDAEDALGELGSFERVPDPQSFFVVGIVVVALGDDSLDLGNGLFVQVGRDRLDDDVVDEAAHDSGAFRWREVARHGGVVGKELGVVRAAAVAAVLLLFSSTPMTVYW